MSPTLLELLVAIVLLVAAWQIGVAIAPWILRWLGSLKTDIDEAADEALEQQDHITTTTQHKEHNNGTRR